MIRTRCVTCDSGNLNELFTHYKTPVSIGCSTQPMENDIFSDIRYVLCDDCACAQIATPVDSMILYKESHNNTYNTPTWAQHHEEFCNFILSNTLRNSFLEIGGSTGVLAKKLLKEKPSLSYSIVDLCATNPTLENVPFYNANCEDFSYKDNDSLILSHVFEHLYTPLKFLSRVKDSSVPEIFISIPNMKVSLKNGSLSFLHVEHTFYIDDLQICEMFAKHKYVCVKKLLFKDHSFFLHFVRSEASLPTPSPLEVIEERKHIVRKYFKDRSEVCKHLVFNKPFFLVPSGHFGQFLYHSLAAEKDKMLGFLDNDTSKIGKRLYGTHLTIFPMNEVQKYTEPITIVIHAGPYIQEIKEQLGHYHPNLTFFEINLRKELENKES